MSDDRRATRPLNPSAIAAANAAVAADTRGRRLTADPKDAALRSKWFDAYEAAGGKTEPNKPKGNIGGTIAPCKITTIEIVSINFLSDHALLKDYNIDWSDNGARYPEPEWTLSAQYPISHTMEQRVRIKVQLKVGPDGTCEETGTLRGIGPRDMLFEAGGVTFKPGLMEIIIESDKNLEKQVEELPFTIEWSVIGTSAALSPTRTSNLMFVTMDTPTAPTEPGITFKRMKQAIYAVGGALSLDPHKIINHIMSNWGNFNLNAPFPNAWELVDSSVGGDCQTIVRYTQNVLKMVGCPGTAEAYVVWAKVPAPTVGVANLFDKPNMASPKQWYNSFNPLDPAKRSWRATLFGGGGFNRYEACLRFTHSGITKYFPGGVHTAAGTQAEMDDPNQVIAVFARMVWVNDGDGLPMTEKGIIHNYR